MKLSFSAKRVISICMCLICSFATCHAEIKIDQPYGGLFEPSSALLRITEGWAKSLEGVSADIVFFGDSITFGGEWEEAFPDQMCINLGVSGDTVYNLAIRMPLIRKVMPTKCFMMIGVNDLLYCEPINEILEMYEWLIIQLDEQREAYGLRVYLQSILPVNEKQCDYDVSNDDIKALNEGIRRLASNYAMEYIDLFPLFVNSKGMLQENYSYDGLHLSDEGYSVWYNALQPFVDE